MGRNEHDEHDHGAVASNRGDHLDDVSGDELRLSVPWGYIQGLHRPAYIHTHTHIL